MKTKIIWFGAIMNLAATAPLFAADLPELHLRRERAMTVGFGGQTLAELQRAPGPGRQVVRQMLLERLEGALVVDTSGSVSQEKTDLSLVRGAVDRRWFLQVRGDGVAASFVDEDALERGRALAVPKSARMSALDLEAKARAFVTTVLADQVVLGAGEKLVPLATQYLMEDGAAVVGNTHSQTDQRLPEVVANRITFGRTIDGVPVLGPGSWVSVTLTNDGAPAEFEYEWPSYVRIGKARTALELDAIVARGAALSAVSLESTGTRIKSMDCGYYDSTSPGSALQPACALDYSHRSQTGMASAHQTVIPATADVTIDAKWGETQLLLRPETQARLREAKIPALRGLLRSAVTHLKAVHGLK